MPDKPRKMTDEQIAKAQELVSAGYLLKDVAKRFRVSPWVLGSYGVKVPEELKRGRYSKLPRA